MTVPGGIELHVSVWSDAPVEGEARPSPFLLVHGLASNARLWDGVAERLHLLGHPVAAVDQRGHGLSDKPDAGYDLATAVEDLAAVMRSLGFERPVLVGQSWGGNVVLELAAQRPGMARGVALVDGGWIELADRFPRWEECAAALAPPSTGGLTPAAMEGRIREAHPDWPEMGIAGSMANYEAGPGGAVAPRLTPERHLRLLRSLWEHRPSTRYAGLSVPVLLVPAEDPEEPNGSDDAVKEAEAHIPRVRTHRMVGDHDLHAQHPEALAGVLHGCVADGFFA